MPAIALVDDRKDDRATIERLLSATLSILGYKGWEVVSEGPPADKNDIFSWLDEHHATVLVADWRLNEGVTRERVAGYEADVLIKVIRMQRPSFPIFIVTGFPDAAHAHLGEVEKICNRTEFVSNAKTIVPQIVRAGQRRHEELGKLWSELDVLAKRSASGNATSEQKERLSQIQGIVQVEFPGVLDLDTILDKLEAFRKRADALRKKIDAKRAMKPKAVK
jgi:hypothetical protein